MRRRWRRRAAPLSWPAIVQGRRRMGPSCVVRRRSPARGCSTARCHQRAVRSSNAVHVAPPAAVPVPSPAARLAGRRAGVRSGPSRRAAALLPEARRASARDRAAATRARARRACRRDPRAVFTSGSRLPRVRATRRAHPVTSVSAERVRPDRARCGATARLKASACSPPRGSLAPACARGATLCAVLERVGRASSARPVPVRWRATVRPRTMSAFSACARDDCVRGAMASPRAHWYGEACWSREGFSPCDRHRDGDPCARARSRDGC